MPILLIVDDDPIMRYLISTAFESFTIIEAVDGQQGLEKFHQQTPDIIITDFLMPGMSGLELIQQIRSKNQDIKIIAISSLYNEQRYCEAVQAAGANFYLPKPFDLDLLKQRVIDLMKCKKAFGE